MHVQASTRVFTGSSFSYWFTESEYKLFTLLVHVTDILLLLMETFDEQILVVI